MADDQLYDTESDQIKKPGWKPFAQPESPGLAPKIDTGAPGPALSDFGTPKPKSVLGDEVKPGEEISPKQMPAAEGAFHQTDPYHGMLKMFGDQKAALDFNMPTDVHNPNMMGELNSYRALRNAIKEREANFKKEHPWGSVDPETGISNHPGFFGKLGHVLGTIGNVAGTAIAPEVTANIPSSRANLNLQSAQAEEGIKEAEGEQAGLERAGAAETSASAHKQEADTHADLGQQKIDLSDRLATTKENDLRNQLGEAVRSGDTEKAQQILDMLKQEKAAQKPMGQQHVSGMLNGKPYDAAFRPDVGKYFDPATGEDISGKFQPMPNQTTSPQMQVLIPSGEPGQAKLQIVHPGQTFNANAAINPSQLTNTNKSVVAEQGSVNSIKGYQRDFQQNRPLLKPPDLEALKVLTAHAQGGIAQQLFQDAGSGVLDALVGQPFTNYTQKLMQGTMTADQYNQLSPAAQKMLFGYTHAIVANFVNMKQKLGSIGRNPDQIQAEMANIPVPYIDTNAANEAFTRTLRDAQATTFNPFSGGQQFSSDQPAPPSNRRVVDLTH